MNKDERVTDIENAFERILGIAPPEGFGEPFATVFSTLYKGDKEEIVTAAYICSLFLSAILEDYPTTKLHTFVHYVQENCRRFTFNCNMYESIFSKMSIEDLKTVCLLSDGNHTYLRECRKEDIFEAFDFYTNR